MIVVENLTKSYGSKKAVDSLSFSVAPGHPRQSGVAADTIVPFWAKRLAEDRPCWH